MNSIRNKIQSAFIGTILVVSVFAVMMLLVNQWNAFQNQQIIQTMTMEYSIISTTEELIEAYNNVGKNTGNAQFLTNYQTLRAKLTNIVSSLKKTIVSQESRMLLLGVENIVDKVIDECDNGIKEILTNNFQHFSDHFAQAHRENEFVQSNTSTLLQKELEYLSKTEERSKQIYLISIAISSGIFIFIIFTMIFFARNFAKQLITPIEQLTKSVEQVSSGNMDRPIDPKLNEQDDEVGILARSFERMVNNIKDMISKLNNSNKEINASKNALEKGNAELKKLNLFMVDREIKMIELKKRISELEKNAEQTTKV